MINFADETFRPQITCDVPSTDNYDVTNLISHKHNNIGFRAEYFVKPPVSVTIKFPLNIDIHRIVLNPIVGKVQSLGFQVFTQSHKIPDDVLLSDCQKLLATFIEEKKSTNVGAQVGNLQCDEARMVCFTNHKYQPSRNFPVKTDIGESKDYVHSDMRHHFNRSLSYVSHVTIRVTRSLRSCAPALKSVQIWGQPSVVCSKVVTSKVLKMHSDSLKNTADFMDNVGNITVCNQDVNVRIKNVTSQPTSHTINHLTPRLQSTYHTINNVNIPEEFIDPITCEIMSIPILLPSGKTIDKSTLDKHVNTESNWGRSGNDPFTGITFSELSKPVVHSSLKSRLDKFLLENCDSLTNVPQTLGRGVDTQRTVKCLSGKKLDKVTSTKNNKRKFDTFPFDHDEKLISSKCPKVITEIKDDKSSYDNSLETSLQSVLKGMTSFTKPMAKFQCDKLTDNRDLVFSNSQSSDSSPMCCVECGDVKLLYELPCDHTLCRSCLLKADVKQLNCTLCGQMCLRKDIVKYNV